MYQTEAAGTYIQNKFSWKPKHKLTEVNGNIPTDFNGSRTN